MKYLAKYKQGALATYADRCPYSISEIGKRCAWMGGFYDSHRWA